MQNAKKMVHQGSTKIQIQPQTFRSRIYGGEMRPLFIFVPLVLETLKEYSADFKNRLRTSKVVSRLENSLKKIQLAQDSQQKLIKFENIAHPFENTRSGFKTPTVSNHCGVDFV